MNKPTRPSLFGALPGTLSALLIALLFNGAAVAAPIDLPGAGALTDAAKQA
ncbi:MAG: hypothetical protein RL748_4328, partial [Pseudomonadota bacterium]